MIELDQMSSTKFYASLLFYSVMKMSASIKELAYLMKNIKLVSKFREILPRLTFYQSDLTRIFDESILTRYKNVFPDLVIRRLADNLTLEDLPSQ